VKGHAVLTNVTGREYGDRQSYGISFANGFAIFKPSGATDRRDSRAAPLYQRVANLA
jgi:hypothetical protein